MLGLLAGHWSLAWLTNLSDNTLPSSVSSCLSFFLNASTAATYIFTAPTCTFTIGFQVIQLVEIMYFQKWTLDPMASEISVLKSYD
jgi:hypothetical protein